MEEVLQVGKWLEFEPDTCFGVKTKHFGILLGVDYEKRKAVVAVNATSRLEKLIRFADLHGIPIEDAMVDVTEDVHFSKPTGIDCHRAQEISLDLLELWIKTNRVYKSIYNENVNPEKYKRIIEIVLNSPLIEEATKNIVRKSNRDIIKVLRGDLEV